MSPAAMEVALTAARDEAEKRGLSVVYFVARDNESKKYCALAGDALRAPEYLTMLKNFCEHQLKEMT